MFYYYNKDDDTELMALLDLYRKKGRTVGMEVDEHLYSTYYEPYLRRISKSRQSGTVPLGHKKNISSDKNRRSRKFVEKLKKISNPLEEESE